MCRAFSQSGEGNPVSSETKTANPYAPPENDGKLHQDSNKESISIAPRVIAVTDSLLAAAFSWMTIDTNISFFAIAVTWTIAFGLFQMKPWAWWAAMVFHCLILVVSTVAYLVLMFLLIRDFDKPPNHMAILTNEAFAVILTIVFAVVACVATIPLFSLRSRGCRVACGILKSESSNDQGV